MTKPGVCVLALLIFCALVDSSPARAEPDVRPERASRPVVRASLGGGIPFGKWHQSADVSDDVRAVFPGALAAGYRFGPHVELTGRGEYGLFWLSDCPEQASCSGYDAKFGLDVAWHFAPTARLEPWLSLGAGYEFAKLEANDSFVRRRGPEFVRVGVGADFALARFVDVGPWLHGSLGRFTDERVELRTGYTDEFAVTGRAFHGFVVIGVRASLRP